MRTRTILFLMLRAKQIARERGHVLTDWLTNAEHGYAVAVCIHCNRAVTVRQKPGPGENPITGPAMAFWCEEKQARKPRKAPPQQMPALART